MLAKQFGAGGDRADHRRGRHGEDRRRTSCASRAGWWISPATSIGLPQSDLLIDPLTFTIATGNEDDRKLAQWTLEGIAAIRAEFPDIQIILGLSNVSFGLNPAARAVLNSRVPRSCGAGRHERRDRACLENPPAAPDRGGGSAGRGGPDLRPPRARATIRCSACWRSSPTARPPTPR